MDLIDHYRRVICDFFIQSRLYLIIVVKAYSVELQIIFNSTRNEPKLLFFAGDLCFSLRGLPDPYRHVALYRHFGDGIHQQKW